MKMRTQETTVHAKEPSTDPMRVLVKADSTFGAPCSPTKIPPVKFRVPEDFDCTKSTRDVYQTDDPELTSYGPFKDIRDSLDKAYHGAYTRERQEMQDELIKRVVFDSAERPQATPWIVFTAGAMVLEPRALTPPLPRE